MVQIIRGMAQVLSSRRACRKRWPTAAAGQEHGLRLGVPGLAAPWLSLGTWWIQVLVTLALVPNVKQFDDLLFECLS